jgi:Glycine cleavage system T protein (aminomethyltransferase)
MIGKNKKDFVGKRSLSRSDTSRKDRKQLVGILPVDKNKNIEEGQHIVEIKSLPGNIKEPIEYLGHITSSYHSPTLKHCVAMALIKGGNQLMGKKIFVSKPNSSETVESEIVNPVFLDPNNKRLLS